MKQANSIVKPKMAGLNKIAMIRGYCDYLESHLNNVARAWIILQEALPHEKIIWNDYDFWMTNALIEDHDADAAVAGAGRLCLVEQHGRGAVDRQAGSDDALVEAPRHFGDER